MKKYTKGVEGSSDANQHEGFQPNLEIQEEIEQNQSPQSPTMVHIRKNKRGNKLIPISHTPTPRHGKHLGVQKRGVSKTHNSSFEVGGGSVPHISEEDYTVFQGLEDLSLHRGGVVIREPPQEQQGEDEERDREQHVPQAKGKGILVTSAEPQQKQRKEKKTVSKQIPKEKTEPELWPKRRNGGLWGEAPDKSAILFGYPHSWAAKVAATKDHTQAIKKLVRQRAQHWPLNDECTAVQLLVNDTGLAPGIHNSMWEYDSVVCAAFRERYWPETDTFHLAFGEMIITPDDVQSILGLEVDGKSVSEGFNNNMCWSDIYALVQETLGWEKSEAEEEFKLVSGDKPGMTPKKGMTKKLLLRSLREKFGGTAKLEKAGVVIDDTRAIRTTRAYLLYMLGTIFFGDNSGNRVNVHYLQWLKGDLGNTHQYSWGTATLAYLLNSLRKASRVRGTEIAGNTGLLQAWVYDHFPTLAHKTKSNGDGSGPTGKKYIFTGTQAKHKEVLIAKMRTEIDAFTVEDVIFDPYVKIKIGDDGNVEDLRELSELASYNGPLYHPFGYVMYNPRRTQRQFGYVQKTVRRENFKLCVNKSMIEGPNIVLNYEPTPSVAVWNNRNDTEDQVQMEELIPSPGTKEAAEDYLDWYRHFGHPIIINNGGPESMPNNTEDGFWKKQYYNMKKKAFALVDIINPCLSKIDVTMRDKLASTIREVIHQAKDVDKTLKTSRPATRASTTTRKEPHPSDEETHDEVSDALRGARTRGGCAGAHTRGGDVHCNLSSKKRRRQPTPPTSP